MTQRTDVHLPGDQAPTVSGEYAVCAVCGTQWQIRGDSDKEGCSLCDAPAIAVNVVSEDENI